jgi:hypothetical protein
MFGRATAAQWDTNGERMSHDQGNGMMADEPRSSRTTATQFLDGVAFTLRTSTPATFRR